MCVCVCVCLCISDTYLVFLGLLKLHLEFPFAPLQPLQLNFIAELLAHKRHLASLPFRLIRRFLERGSHGVSNVNESTSHWKLQALAYGILPPTTAINIDYPVGLEKRSSKESFLDGAQMELSFLQPTQRISGVSFITDHVVYASTHKAKVT